MKTFGKLKPGDIVYELIDNRECVKKNIENDKERKNSSLISISSFEDYRDENSYKYFIINKHIVLKVNPYYIEHISHYMKMNGDRPNGVGTSITKELDPHAIDIEFEDIPHFNKTRIDKDATIYTLNHQKHHYYFVNKKDVKKYYKELVKDFIQDIQNTLSLIKLQKEETNKLLK